MFQLIPTLLFVGVQYYMFVNAKLNSNQTEICLPSPNCCCASSRDGRDGKIGRNGRDGNNGIDGVDGIDGRNGRDGLTVKGQKGEPGEKGEIGHKGIVGEKGSPGTTGVKGEKGERGVQSQTPSLNWKHCVWKREDSKDNGLIQSCKFNKKSSTTALKVSYGGNLRIYGCDSCCKRWYFSFDGKECSNPHPIDGVYYMWKGIATHNLLRHRHIEGICEGLMKGIVNVEFNVGNCAGYGDADANSGWNSISRIMIEELPPMQT